MPESIKEQREGCVCTGAVLQALCFSGLQRAKPQMRLTRHDVFALPWHISPYLQMVSGTASNVEEVVCPVNVQKFHMTVPDGALSEMSNAECK